MFYLKIKTGSPTSSSPLLTHMQVTRHKYVKAFLQTKRRKPRVFLWRMEEKGRQNQVALWWAHFQTFFAFLYVTRKRKLPPALPCLLLPSTHI